MAVTKEAVTEVLRKIKSPDSNEDLVSRGLVKEVGVENGSVFVHLQLAVKAEQVKAFVEKELLALNGVGEVMVQVSAPAAAQAGAQGGQAMPEKQAVAGVRHVVLVASGKGGVGKSTTSVNLAVALRHLGYRVGLMDADIYGPNVPLMLGVNPGQKPLVNQSDQMIPIEAHGIKMISMGVLIAPDQPMVWRGPMLHKALLQLLHQVEWGSLDYLLIDLPPGTGDVHLSLAQNVVISGAVVVTTPQEVSLMDVRKAVAMFQKTEVPILGIIENMTGDVFGSGGGQKAAEQYGVPFLGQIPLDSRIRAGGDAGQPVVATTQDAPATVAFHQAANLVVEHLNQTAGLKK